MGGLRRNSFKLALAQMLVEGGRKENNAKEPYGQLWLDNYCPVAGDFRLWIAGVSNVGWLEDGPWNGRKCIGCSLVVGPNGQKVLMGPYGEGAEAILYADIDLKPRPARG